MKMKSWLKLGTTAALAVCLAACGSKSTSKVELEYFSQKPEMAKTLQEMIKDFEKENPDVHIKFTNVPDPGTVLKTRMANNEAPDIINIYPQNADFQGWAKDGQFLELTKDAGTSNLKEGAAETYAVEDKLYSLPLTANAYGIFYNKSKFEELGLKVPETIEDFKKLVADAKNKGETPFALSLGDSWSLNGYHQLAWATSAGGYDGAEDILIRSPKDAISADNPSLKAVVEDLALLKGNGQKGADGAKYADTVAAFAKGDALMMPQGIWALTILKQQKPDFEVGMFAFPAKEKGKELTVGAADLALSISSKTKHPKEAEKFLSYMSQAEVIQKYYDVDGSPTSVKGVKTDGKFPETEGVTQYAFTDKHIVWLQKEWQSEEEFWNITVKTVKNPDAGQLATDLNGFFNPMK